MTNDTKWVIGTLFLIAGLLATQMNGTNRRIDDVNGRLDRIESRLDGFDDRLRNVEISVGKIDQRLLTIERVVLPAPEEAAE